MNINKHEMPLNILIHIGVVTNNRLKIGFPIDMLSISAAVYIAMKSIL
jgi:hypothetical protein